MTWLVILILSTPPHNNFNANIDITLTPLSFLFASDVPFLIKSRRYICIIFSIAFTVISNISYKLLHDMPISFVLTLMLYLNILSHLIQRSHSAMEDMLISRPLKTYNIDKETFLNNTAHKQSRELKHINPQIVKEQQSRELKQQSTDSEGRTEWEAQITTHR